jgi:penicillin amidase
MAFFGMGDPRWVECADRSWLSELGVRLWRQLCAIAAIAVFCAVVYAGNTIAGLQVRAVDAGTVAGLPIAARIEIVRDRRGIPHIRAAGVRDLFFAEGFAQGSDRLFQMDLTRRYAYGTLSEIFGSGALGYDEELRAIDAAHVAQRQWRAAGSFTRMALQAFAAGVNAAETRQPLPLEFRMLLYRPAPWTPQDSIAVSVVAAYELADSWNDVLRRDRARRLLGDRCFDLEFPLSDPRYDVSVNGVDSSSEPAPHMQSDCEVADVALAPARPHAGSNAWAAGSARSSTHDALIANDPHADVTIPGIWYVVDLQAPGFHCAGAVLPGLPGVTLGHNERIAWAVTNADVATTVVYRAFEAPKRDRRIERFIVRFAPDVWRAYYRTADAFSAPEGAWVRWPIYEQRQSSIVAGLALDRARGAAQAMRALSRYHGSPANFLVADTSGAIAYHLAGDLPDDPAWGREVHPASDLRKPLRLIPFDALPSRPPSRDAILMSANNRPYGAHYPYRLSAAFEPPYRAFRIASLLRARRRYDAQYFARMQLDTFSPVDAEIAKDAGLRSWNGRFDPQSVGASRAYDLRSDLQGQQPTLSVLLATLREPQAGDDALIRSALAASANQHRAWGDAGRIDVDNPLSPFWYGMLRGQSFPGDGDDFTIHLQEQGFAQAFRAVWEAGNWDAGGIVLPSGESGEPGSRHYDDLAQSWIRGDLAPLPFSRRAIDRAAASTLTLLP